MARFGCKEFNVLHIDDGDWVVGTHYLERIFKACSTVKCASRRVDFQPKTFGDREWRMLGEINGMNLLIPVEGVNILTLFTAICLDTLQPLVCPAAPDDLERFCAQSFSLGIRNVVKALWGEGITQVRINFRGQRYAMGTNENGVMGRAVIDQAKSRLVDELCSCASMTSYKDQVWQCMTVAYDGTWRDKDGNGQAILLEAGVGRSAEQRQEALLAGPLKTKPILGFPEGGICMERCLLYCPDAEWGAKTKIEKSESSFRGTRFLELQVASFCTTIAKEMGSLKDALVQILEFFDSFITKGMWNTLMSGIRWETRISGKCSLQCAFNANNEIMQRVFRSDDEGILASYRKVDFAEYVSRAMQFFHDLKRLNVFRKKHSRPVTPVEHRLQYAMLNYLGIVHPHLGEHASPSVDLEGGLYHLEIDIPANNGNYYKDGVGLPGGTRPWPPTLKHGPKKNRQLRLEDSATCEAERNRENCNGENDASNLSSSLSTSEGSSYASVGDVLLDYDARRLTATETMEQVRKIMVRDTTGRTSKAKKRARDER